MNQPPNNNPKIALPLPNLDQRDVRATISRAVEELGAFISILNKRFGGQLPHDVFSNLPDGVVQLQTLPKHAVRLALVGAIGEYLNWNTDQVSHFAAEVLEDSNVHDLAKLVYELIQNSESEEAESL